MKRLDLEVFEKHTGIFENLCINEDLKNNNCISKSWPNTMKKYIFLKIHYTESCCIFTKS